MLRQLEDNARAGNHMKENVIEDQVNMEDFLEGRHNAIRRVESMDSAMVVPHVDVTAPCVAVMDYWDKIRTERTGSSLDLQANNLNMPSNVGDSGVNTLVANLEQVSALITENVTETLVKSLYKIVHKYLRLYFPEDMSSRMAGQWSTTNPSQWLERDSVSIVLPPSRSQKIIQQVALEKMIVSAKMELQQGNAGITTSLEDIYQMECDHARLSGIDNPEKYLVNPSSQQAQQAQQMQQQQQGQMQQMQEQERQEDRQFAKMLQSKQLQIAESEVQRNWKNDIEELQVRLAELQNKTEFDFTKLSVDANSGRESDQLDSQTKLTIAGSDDKTTRDVATLGAQTDIATSNAKNDADAEIAEAKMIADATTKLELESLRKLDNEAELSD